MTSSDALLLYGTEEAPPPSRTLRAGNLSADLQQGNLRDIRLGGIELMRGIAFLVRTPRWATYDPDITDLVVRENDDSFHVTYRASVRDGEARLGWIARIDGRADGTLHFTCDMQPETDFVTCRAGFVVLHPADVAGARVTIEHGDGRSVDSTFPELIDPVQPMMDLRALTHRTASGLTVTCRMEGDVFEMEDQRNWSDASFKTYVRPLSRPWPYTLPAGERQTQSVSLSTAPGGTAGVAAPDAAVRIDAGAALGPMPALGIGCTPAEARAALPHAARLSEIGIHRLVCRFDAGQGHVASDLAAFRALAEAIGAVVELQIVVQSVDDFASELRAVAADLREMALAPETIAVSPAPDLKSTTPGQPWPACAPLERVYEAARAAFPDTSLAGGTFAYFTELNRKRPPLALLDAVTFSSAPVVHAGDDRSVMESLQALPAIAASARAIAGDRPLLVGPSAIGMRDNPYGPAPLENPPGARMAMGGRDPRQRGLFNAAWTLGYIANFAAGGAARIAVSAPIGTCGVLDENGPFPVFWVLRGLTALRGATLHATQVSQPQRVAALLAALPTRHELWIANLTDRAQTVTLPAAFARGRMDVLDLDSLRRGGGFRDVAPAAGDAVACGPFAVLRVHSD